MYVDVVGTANVDMYGDVEKGLQDIDMSVGVRG